MAYGPTSGGAHVTMNVITPTVIKASAGQVYRVFVNTAPSAAGGVYDVTTTSATAAANLVCAIPTTVGPVYIDAPMDTGIVVDPGTGGVVSVSWT